MSDEIEWTPVKVKLGDLSHWADNPVTLSKAQAKKLLRSKEKLGKMQTLAIGPSNGDGKYPLYDGHQRANVWGAAFGMGLEVWALQSSRLLTDDERHAVPIMLRTAAGSLDWDALAGWTEYPISEWGLDDDALQGMKFDIAALGNLLESENGDGNGTGNDEIPSQWMILIECANETSQAELLARFSQEGLKCRALIS
jgi:hypothetical protein